MRNLKKHIIMVSAAAMFAAAGLAGNSVFAAEPTTDNFVLPPQMTEQQKADWAKDNPQYREGPKDKRFKHHKNPRFDQQKGNEQGQHKKDHKFGPRDGQPTPPPDAGFQPRPDGQMQPEE